jgi:ATP-dependent RNA helicase RhlE
MPPNILEFANTMLRNPVRVEVARESTAAETVDQKMMFVMQADKRDLLVHLLQQPEVETALVFMRTKYGADKVVRYLSKNKLNAAAIHGNKTQPQRERAMQGFRKGTINILVATDIAARGIDVSGVSHVINFEIPNISETYVHRIGRTGRAGASGVAWSFVNEADERKFMSDIQQLMKREVPLITDHPWHLAKPALELDLNKSNQRPQAPGSGGSKKKKKKPFNHGKPRHGGGGNNSGSSGKRFRSDRDGGGAPRRDGGGGQSSSGRPQRGKGKSSGNNSGGGNNGGNNGGNRGGQSDSRYSRR